jgi:hypothetical protein
MIKRNIFITIIKTVGVMYLMAIVVTAIILLVIDAL